MKPYKDLDKNSLVEAYSYGEHRIDLRLKDGQEKEFSDTVVTPFELNSLKVLADTGRGLDEYMKEIELRYNAK